MNNLPVITIGIPIYNRLDLLKIMASSLYKSDLSISHNIRLYDDCSTEFDYDNLKEIFPTAKTININKLNQNASKNMYLMYKDFLTTNDDFFFNADSDIIFNKQWLNIAIKKINETDGILSLFNTSSHSTYSIIDESLCLKNTIGAAGTLFKRESIEKIINHFNSSENIYSFDWQWCEFFNNNNTKIYCLNNSLIQHIGYTGLNSKIYFDYGKNFMIDSISNGQIINEILSIYIENVQFQINNILKNNNTIIYHLKIIFKIIVNKIFPYSLIKKIKHLLKM